jgi:orotate phosphoribosyltransferase
MERSELAKQLYLSSMIRGEFLLRSGRTSDVYFDKYLFESTPALLRAIAEHMADLVPESVEALAGLEMGGIPIATMLSQLTGLDALFVRKKAKEYGTCKLAEGGEAARRLLVIEDVVTSGGQIIESVGELRSLGATIDDVVCVIDRQAGGAERLKAEGLTLHPLFTMSQLEEAGG